MHSEFKTIDNFHNSIFIIRLILLHLGKKHYLSILLD